MASIVRSGVMGLLFTTLLGPISCQRQELSRSSFPPDGVPGEPPVWAVVDHLDYGRMVFYPEPNTDWMDLLDMRLFAGFSPGMSFAAAQKSVGQPNESGENHFGPFWDYHRSLGTVRIAHELKGSVPFLRRWRLKGFPKSSSLEAVFHRNVHRWIPESRASLEVVIMNNRGSPGAFVKVAKGEVSWIDWIDNPGSGGTRDRS